MSSEITNPVMTIESLQMKIENQNNIMKQLSNENEELYQQFNHLMIRNNKLLKRIDDLQGIIDDLHIRIEELQLINGNILKINDKIKSGNEHITETNDRSFIENDHSNEESENNFNFNTVFSHWKNYPGQDARNEPNLRKQAQMLVHLYYNKSLRASDLFLKTGVGGVTGARYVASLKKFGMINYTGARKKGQYQMTEKGIDFIEKANQTLESEIRPQLTDTYERSNFPKIELEGIPVKQEVKDLLASHFDHADL
jgi:predicted transcriptional regulator